MDWYWIILIVIGYILMWVITSVALSRWAKNNSPGWAALGFMWPLTITCIPIVWLFILICSVIEKYEYKEE